MIFYTNFTNVENKVVLLYLNRFCNALLFVVVSLDRIQVALSKQLPPEVLL